MVEFVHVGLTRCDKTANTTTTNHKSHPGQERGCDEETSTGGAALILTKKGLGEHGPEKKMLGTDYMTIGCTRSESVANKQAVYSFVNLEKRRSTGFTPFLPSVSRMGLEFFDRFFYPLLK